MREKGKGGKWKTEKKKSGEPFPSFTVFNVNDA
jgi:hypothetical protein